MKRSKHLLGLGIGLLTYGSLNSIADEILDSGRIKDQPEPNEKEPIKEIVNKYSFTDEEIEKIKSLAGKEKKEFLKRIKNEKIKTKRPD